MALATILLFLKFNLFLIGSEYDQEIPQSHTADQPTAYFYLILYVPVKILLTYVRLGLPASGLNHHLARTQHNDAGEG